MRRVVGHRIPHGMQLLFAASNPHKIEEVQAILAPLGIEVIGLDAIDNPPKEPVEDGDTFAENARIKAVYYARRAGRPCLADDSGLKVDAISGEPGVISARYAGMGRSRREKTAANNTRLLKELVDVPDEKRAARFVCAMCLADADGNVLAETHGALVGVIARSPRGESGFGYDPLLFLPDVGRTVAELTEEEKNARSHRGEAARAMARCIAELNLT